MTKIMLVEDDKSLREIYGVRLIAEGYEIISAGDGEQALAMAVKEKPDLVLSDVMMPKISGFDMLDILRATPETKDMKVIMMTALSSDDQRSRGESLGANKYLVKSQVGIEDVVRSIHDVLADTPNATPVKPAEFNTPVPSETIQTTVAPVNTLPLPNIAPVPTPEAAPAMSTTNPVNDTQPAVPVVRPANIAVPQRPQPETPVPMTPVVPGIVPAPPIAQPTAIVPPVQPIQTVTPFTVPTQNESALPQPTAPFSTSAPASLGERVINPINQIDTKPDIADLISQELNDPGVIPAPIPPEPILAPQPPVSAPETDQSPPVAPAPPMQS